MNSKVEICILAGGLSSRMGRDKAHLRLGGSTLLARIRRTAKSLNLPVRVIRRDLIPRCGPLGGIFIALKTTRADAVLFLACDMPNVSSALLEKLLQQFKNASDPIFTAHESVVGFPFILNRPHLSAVEKLLAEKTFSLQAVAKKVRAKKFRPTRPFQSDLLNVNTPEDWERLKMTNDQRRMTKECPNIKKYKRNSAPHH